MRMKRKERRAACLLTHQPPPKPTVKPPPSSAKSNLLTQTGQRQTDFIALRNSCLYDVNNTQLRLCSPVQLRAENSGKGH